MLEGLVRAYQAGDQWGALLRAYHLAFLALALPGVPLGLLYWLTKPAAPSPYPMTLALALLGLAASLAGGVLVMVRRSIQKNGIQKNSVQGSRAPVPLPVPLPERLTAALQLGSAPGVPFLLGCGSFHDPPTWLGCWAVALAAYGLGRRQVRALLTAR